MTARPVQRGYGGALFDRLVSWLQGVPAGTCSYTITPLKIPLEGEDVQLAADLYQPVLKNNEAPAGTILIQCPYGRVLMTLSTRYFASRGYVVLFVSCRGTFGSGGKFDAGRMESDDGPRVVEWMRQQLWYTGSFATIGESYLAYTQWALMSDPGGPPDDMVAAIPMIGPHDFSKLLWGTGALWLTCVDWANITNTQETQPLFGHIYRMLTTDMNTLAHVKKSVPLIDGARSFLKGKSPWLLEWIARPDPAKDPFYDSMKHERAFYTSKVSILLIAGWQDVFCDTVIEQYQLLRDNGCNVALTVGPWNHLQAATGEGVTKQSLEWFDKHLAKRVVEEIRPAPVRIHVTGVNEWRWLPSWPPTTTPLELSLAPQRALAKQQPDKRTEVSFTFDPHDPNPTMGGPLLFHGGVVDDTALSKRSDVLTFTTAPLEQGLEVLGRAHIELCHSSDSVHVDLFVRLCEVNAKGVSHNVTEVYKRLDPGRARAGEAVKVELDLTDCAHRFNKGASIRVLVAGGNWPSYSFNLGTGEDQGTGTTMKPVTHTLQLGGKLGSKLVLPVKLLD